MKIHLSLCLTSLLLLGAAHAAASDCFPSVEAYAASHYGQDFRDDDNIVLSKKKFGGEVFDMLEDRTSGTNHARFLLRRHAGKYCVALKTPAVAQLVAIATNDHGMPLKFQSSDQAPPGLPQHEITYTLNPVSLEYEAGECREITYVGKARTAKPTDCRRLFE